MRNIKWFVNPESEFTFDVLSTLQTRSKIMTTPKSLNMLRILFVLVVLTVCNGTALSETYIVENTNDSGPGSLREAIESANANNESDLIEFDIPAPGPHVISPLSALPDIEESVIIDGYTQDGSFPATTATAANLEIVLDGSISSGKTGLVIRNADNCVIRGLKVQGFTNDGIGVEGNHNSVEGNHVFNCALSGIYIGGAYNTIGGTTPANRNVVNEGNVGIGIFPGATNNRIEGNYVGTDVDGQYDDGFHGYEGVAIGGSHNTIAGNLISGYDGEIGVSIQRWEGHPIPEYNVVEGNRIGTNVYGNLSIPNGLGILIDTAMKTTVKGNLIVGNRFHGVEVRNSLLLINEDDLAAIGNCITQNAIYDNGELGINLAPLDTVGWVTENDPGDGDTGPNLLMNFPVLTSAMATPGQLIVKGTIDTQDSRQVTLEFFANSAPDNATGYGEGEFFLGTATPNAKGKFTATLPSVPSGMWISATATNGDGNTSEFAESIIASGPGGHE